MRTELLKRPEEDDAERERRRTRTTPRRTGSIWAVFIVLAAVLFVSSFLLSQVADFGTRSRQAEARAALMHVLQLQRVRAGTTGSYGRTFREIGFDAPQGSVYTYFMFDDVVHAQADGAAHPVSAQFPPAVFQRFFKPPPEGFVAVAAGNIDGDPDLDIWVMDDQNRLENALSDVED